jgi:hypothetical protein
LDKKIFAKAEKKLHIIKRTKGVKAYRKKERTLKKALRRMKL